MALSITNYNNRFKIKGILTKRQISEFQEAFKHVFEANNAITLNIEGLEKIDRYGVNALAQLHNEALNKNKRVSIIGGNACKELFDYFKREEAA